MSGPFFEKKIDFWSFFAQKWHFSLYTIFNFFDFFSNFWPYKHILFRGMVKLNADSEFLVHFELGPHFMGLKWAKSWKKVKNKKKTFFSQNVHELIKSYYVFYIKWDTCYMHVKYLRRQISCHKKFTKKVFLSLFFMVLSNLVP